MSVVVAGGCRGSSSCVVSDALCAFVIAFCCCCCSGGNGDVRGCVFGLFAFVEFDCAFTSAVCCAVVVMFVYWWVF